jgi:hypothetical protein
MKGGEAIDKQPKADDDHSIHDDPLAQVRKCQKRNWTGSVTWNGGTLSCAAIRSDLTPEVWKVIGKD